MEGGFHYHCCVEVTGVKKWLSVKNNIRRTHKIVVNFSDMHTRYIYAYRYVCKSDQEVVHSPGHPDLSNVGSPRTKAGTKALQQASWKRKNGSKQCANESCSSKSRRLTNLQVSDFIVANNITTLMQLFAKAELQKQECECDLALFLFSRSQKLLGELVSKARLLKTASVSLAGHGKYF